MTEEKRDDDVCLDVDGRPAEGLEDRCDAFMFRASSGSRQCAFEVISSREEEYQSSTGSLLGVYQVFSFPILSADKDIKLLDWTLSVSGKKFWKNMTFFDHNDYFYLGNLEVVPFIIIYASDWASQHKLAIGC